MFRLIEDLGKSCFILLLLITASVAFSLKSKASSLSNTSLLKSKIEYQYAAQFSSLKWRNLQQSPIAVSMPPIKNYSGIPTNALEVKPGYYEHGKLPSSIDRLFQDLVLSTRLLENSQQNSDVELQLILDHYSHPFKYAPDDHWYRSLKDQVDRWGITKKNAKVGLTLRMTSKSHRFKPWVSSVESTLSQCDLNAISHPLMPINHSDHALIAYTESSMGQAFISASNYLLLQAVTHLNKQQQRALVVSTAHNELLLNSEHSQFITGEKYRLFFNRAYSHPNKQSTGQVEVVKTMGNQAVAYPVDLRPDHLKVGDWIEIEKAKPLIRPNSVFVAKNNCATVGVAQLSSSEEGIMPSRDLLNKESDSAG